MPEQPKLTHALKLLQELQHSADIHHHAVQAAPLDPRLLVLRQWQAARLARTYADLLASQRYGPACAFFLSDMYAARDFSQRDHDITQVYAFMSRLLPASMLHLLALVVELNELTRELDDALLKALVGKLGVTDSISQAQYAEAYRICDNYVERARQIDLIVEVGREVDKMVRLPLVSTTLRLAGPPARRAGWHELHSFLERGYVAFRHMRGADRFLKTIHDRETLLLDKIFSGEAEPFGSSEQ